MSGEREQRALREFERVCRTCRYWDVHSRQQRKGDCRAPDNHRYSRVPMETTRSDGTVFRSWALLDSFGPEETLPTFTCGAWDDGEQLGNRKDGSSPKNPVQRTGGDGG